MRFWHYNTLHRIPSHSYFARHKFHHSRFNFSSSDVIAPCRRPMFGFTSTIHCPVMVECSLIVISYRKICISALVLLIEASHMTTLCDIGHRHLCCIFLHRIFLLQPSWNHLAPSPHTCTKSHLQQQDYIVSTTSAVFTASSLQLRL